MANESSNPLLSQAKTLLESLKKKAKHTTKKRNLDLVWQALEAIRAEKCDRFTVSEVARRLEPLGGPKEQSLRNAQGADFRALIDAYGEGAKLLMPKSDATQLEKAIALIPDPSIRVVLKEFFAENKRLKHENDQLRAAFKTLSIGQQTQPSSGSALLPLPNSAPVFSSAARQAIAKGFDAKRLRERGLSITQSGAIEDSSGLQLFPPGFASGIQQFLRDTDKE